MPREGVNPLRPYYIPAHIGDEPLAPGPGAAGVSSNPFFNGAHHGRESSSYALLDDLRDWSSRSGSAPASSFSLLRDARQLVDDLLWRYASVLMAQPFEVAKTILQVRSAEEALAVSPTTGAGEPSVARLPQTPMRRESWRGYDEYHDSDSEADEPAYFTSASAAGTPTPSFHRRNSASRRAQQSPVESPRMPSSATSAGASSSPSYRLALRRPDSVLEVIGQLWARDGGARGVWKGSNAAFLYAVLSSLLENWSRSCLSALFDVPDVGELASTAVTGAAVASGGSAGAGVAEKLLDLAAPYPWASLAVAAAAAVCTGLLLAPLDMVKTRMFLTPTSLPPRRTLPTLRALPSYLCPPSLVVPTALHSLAGPLLALSMPLAIRRTRFLGGNPSLSGPSVASPGPFVLGLVRFAASAAALFVKLPLETVLRRGQVAVLARRDHVEALAAVGGGPTKPQYRGTASLATVVPPGRYNGLLGTMYYIVAEEGTRQVKVKSSSKDGRGKVATPRTPLQQSRRTGRIQTMDETTMVYRKGQGLEGLWRGWKVGWWGLVGLWTVGLLGNGNGEGEF